MSPGLDHFGDPRKDLEHIRKNAQNLDDALEHLILNISTYLLELQGRVSVVEWRKGESGLESQGYKFRDLLNHVNEDYRERAIKLEEWVMKSASGSFVLISTPEDNNVSPQEDGYHMAYIYCVDGDNVKQICLKINSWQDLESIGLPSSGLCYKLMGSPDEIVNRYTGGALETVRQVEEFCKTKQIELRCILEKLLQDNIEVYVQLCETVKSFLNKHSFLLENELHLEQIFRDSLQSILEQAVSQKSIEKDPSYSAKEDGKPFKGTHVPIGQGLDSLLGLHSLLDSVFVPLAENLNRVNTSEPERTEIYQELNAGENMFQPCEDLGRVSNGDGEVYHIVMAQSDLASPIKGIFCEDYLHTPVQHLNQSTIAHKEPEHVFGNTELKSVDDQGRFLVDMPLGCNDVRFEYEKLGKDLSSVRGLNKSTSNSNQRMQSRQFDGESFHDGNDSIKKHERNNVNENHTGCSPHDGCFHRLTSDSNTAKRQSISETRTPRLQSSDQKLHTKIIAPNCQVRFKTGNQTQTVYETDISGVRASRIFRPVEHTRNSLEQSKRSLRSSFYRKLQNKSCQNYGKVDGERFNTFFNKGGNSITRADSKAVRVSGLRSARSTTSKLLRLPGYGERRQAFQRAVKSLTRARTSPYVSIKNTLARKAQVVTLLRRVSHGRLGILLKIALRKRVRGLSCELSSGLTIVQRIHQTLSFIKFRLTTSRCSISTTNRLKRRQEAVKTKSEKGKNLLEAYKVTYEFKKTASRVRAIRLYPLRSKSFVWLSRYLYSVVRWIVFRLRSRLLSLKVAYVNLNRQDRAVQDELAVQRRSVKITSSKLRNRYRVLEVKKSFSSGGYVKGSVYFFRNQVSRKVFLFLFNRCWILCTRRDHFEWVTLIILLGYSMLKLKRRIINFYRTVYTKRGKTEIKVLQSTECLLRKQSKGTPKRRRDRSSVIAKLGTNLGNASRLFKSQLPAVTNHPKSNLFIAFQQGAN